MADQTCTWTGLSGNTYEYSVHSLPMSFERGQEGNYIYAKLVNGRWRPIYIGEGDLGDRIGDNHHKARCIKEKEATHVHVHLNVNKENLKAEESDLLASYSQAYEPTGCNDKVGG